MTDVNELRLRVLRALGTGGTTEMADRVLGLVRELSVTPLPRLGGLSEYAAAHGHSKSTVGHWLTGRRTPPYPLTPTLAHVAATPLWDMDDVERDIARHRYRPNPRRKAQADA